VTRPLVFAGGVPVGNGAAGAALAAESGAAMDAAAAISDSFSIIFSVFVGVFMIVGSSADTTFEDARKRQSRRKI
jgi:hypothetical protein